MLEYTEENIKLILDKIKLNTIDDNGCKIWTGRKQKEKNIAFLYINKYIVYPNQFLWNYHNPENKQNKQYQNVIRTCGNKLCLKVDHLKLVPKLKGKQSKEEIWNRLVKNSTRTEYGCLEWNNEYKGRYYINTEVNSIPCFLHQASYWIHNNELETVNDIPKINEFGVRLVIRHLCNNNKCFEPTHLKLGTQFENDYDDKLENGTLQYGEKHYNVSITEEVARKIKASKFPRNDPRYKSKKERAKEYGTTVNVVADMDCEKSWSHIILDTTQNNKVDDRRRVNARGSRKIAKNRIWTDEMFETARQKLSSKIKISDTIRTPFVNTPCHMWLGSISQGYGHMTIFGKDMRTHVLAGEINIKQHRPSGLIARHLCGNKECCNPEHIKFGTLEENSADTKLHKSYINKK